MPSFKIERSGYGSRKNLESILKVSIGSGKENWQKIQPGLLQTGQIIQAMAEMDSTSTKALKALNRFQKKNLIWEAKPQNNISGPDCSVVIPPHPGLLFKAKICPLQSSLLKRCYILRDVTHKAAASSAQT
ncbi:hypothetical protein E5288_WYG011126 [Bos mutus]|uniref:Uncharacterized protein n=1 Tax=Bos mutus TaxID=72004 RepID=A0A6B0RQU3_9CETA|nr:hypothetical protein [Bos mutus]